MVELTFRKEMKKVQNVDLLDGVKKEDV